MRAEVTIVIPTFGREQVLIDTVRMLLELESRAAEMVIVDQTPQHEPQTERQLREWAEAGAITLVRREVPSIPGAMNAGVRAATQPIVLFLDDDIIPHHALIAAHAAGHASSPVPAAVVGQVLQPEQQPEPRNGYRPARGFFADMDFPFHSTETAWVSNVMAGNLSVKREWVLKAGGFDENFIGAAYRFETDFCRRLIRAGGRVLFEPAASIRHLRALRGGTRSTGSHLTSASPVHGMGDYYFALRSGISTETLRYMARRPVREVCTRFHLRHPWYIPVKLVGELRAFSAAVSAQWRGPKLIDAVPAPAPTPAAAAR